MGKIKKKYESGEASHYFTRKQSLRKLQLSLKMFRRLCILKGIYPREPKNRKRAQSGATDKKTLYLKKDIQFLLHEPIVWKLREHKVFMKKKARAKALRNFDELKRLKLNQPCYKLDHIVKERYPTFIDAIRDLDDCLTLTSLFSTFPNLRFVPLSVSHLSRKLTVEFMHYIIEARALRKVFISIKGFYFQAEVKGQTVTWIIPHNFSFQPQSSDDVDFRIMGTFVEFYNTLLGFINFRLFHSLNIFYPPMLCLKHSETAKDKELVTEEELVSERVAALNMSLEKTKDIVQEEEVELDEFVNNDDPSKIEELKQEAERIKKLKRLFEGMKVYLNREVPREPLAFIIRAFGGEVSWDRTLFPGATFDENDESVTHQIVDRPISGKQFVSRYYLQPQWIFDSVNARTLLPCQLFFPGAVLPSHVSPFKTEREGDYVPPEKKKFFDLEKGIIAPEKPYEETQGNEEEEDGEVEDDDLELLEGDDDDDDDDDEEEDEEDEEEDDEDEEGAEGDEDEVKMRKNLKKEMKVEKGKLENVDYIKMRDDEDKEQYRLRVMMIRNKHKRLYKRMMDSRRRRRIEADKLVSKRNSLEGKTSKKKKGKKAASAT